MTAEQLVTDNIKLARHIAKQYRNLPIEYDDLFQLACEGLVRAARSYDPSKCVKFSTYAAHCIYSAINMHWRTVRRQPDTVSLSEPAGRNKEGLDFNKTLGDELPDAGPTPDEIVANNEKIDQMLTILHKLPPRMKEILYMYYGLGGRRPLNQREIAEIYRLSQSIISRIITKARKQILTMKAAEQ